MVTLLLVLVSCGVLVLGQLQEVDKQCQDQAQCVFRDQCQAFTEVHDKFQSLTRGSAERSRVLSLMKGSVCNKADRGVCCPEDPCNLGQTCMARGQCQDFQQLTQKMNETPKGSLGRSSLLAELKDRICNKKTKAVCCDAPQISRSTGQAPRAPTLRGCDPSNGSCLPSLGDCGLSGGEQRVVGGNNTIPGEFPFTALLGRTVQKNYLGQEYNETRWTCGGTLINRRYVLTAAHCHNPTRVRKQITKVRLGEYQVTNDPSLDCVSKGDPSTCLPKVQDFIIASEDVIRHPEYERSYQTGLINDIALIRLPSLAEMNLGVKVVCLPIDSVIAADQLNVPDIGEGLASFYPTVVGWGFIEPDPFKQELVGEEEKVGNPIQQKLPLPVLTKAKCLSSLGFTPKDSTICAGGERGKDSCSVR